MTKFSDYRKSSYLQKSDVEKPIIVTIVGHTEVNTAFGDEEAELEPALIFKELDKPLILKATNNTIISAITGSSDFEDWMGTKIVLFVDPTVQYKGKITGGIRCRAPKQQQKPILPPTPEPQRETEDESEAPF